MALQNVIECVGALEVHERLRPEEDRHLAVFLGKRAKIRVPFGGWLRSLLKHISPQYRMITRTVYPRRQKGLADGRLARLSGIHRAAMGHTNINFIRLNLLVTHESHLMLIVAHNRDFRKHRPLMAEPVKHLCEWSVR